MHCFFVWKSIKGCLLWSFHRFHFMSKGFQACEEKCFFSPVNLSCVTFVMIPATWTQKAVRIGIFIFPTTKTQTNSPPQGGIQNFLLPEKCPFISISQTFPNTIQLTLAPMFHESPLLFSLFLTLFCSSSCCASSWTLPCYFNFTNQIGLLVSVESIPSCISSLIIVLFLLLVFFHLNFLTAYAVPKRSKTATKHHRFRIASNSTSMRYLKCSSEK